MARSLGPARTRAEDRVQRFLDAAIELAEDGASGKEFTVQEVVERSGQSLRSFYLYFGGKQELLLALFEESVRTTTESCARRSTRRTTRSGACTASWSSTTASAARREGASGKKHPTPARWPISPSSC